MQTRYCVECDEFYVDIVGWEVRCMAGFRPRFYPKAGGFKRKCKTFYPLEHHSDIQDNIDDLASLGYKYAI